MPKVSVIIPTYNYGRFICYAVNSVLNQSYKDYELLVVDDGSKDNTAERVKKYDDRIKYYYKDNGGPASARNFGIKKSNGDYICFLDADDLFIHNKLELQVDLLDQKIKEGVGLIYSDYLCIDEYNTYILKHYKSKGFQSQNEALKCLLSYNFINTSTVMVAKECLEEVGLFNENYKYLEDLDLWIRIGSIYKYEYINKPLVKTRSHSNNLRNKIRKLDKIQCFNKIKNDFMDSKS